MAATAKIRRGRVARRKTGGTLGTARGRGSRGRANAIKVYELGDAAVLAYRRRRDGKHYRHDFGRGVKVYATLDGSTLIIRGGKLRVSDFIRG